MLNKKNIKDIYTLTPMQEGMLFHSLYEKSSYAYLEQVSYRLRGELDIEIVKKSCNQLLKRYDVLRTVFVHEGVDRPIQVVLKEREIDFYYEDISTLTDEEKEVFINQYKKTDRKRSFDLSKDVLMRVALVRTDEAEFEFAWSYHHILIDGWCFNILISDYFEIYNSFLQNRPYRLPEVSPYRDYILWLEKQNKKEALNYWWQYLEYYEEAAGIPKLNTLEINGAAYDQQQVVLQVESEKTTALNRLARRYNVTQNTAIQSIWGILLGKYNNTKDVVFGAVVSGRPSEIAGIESMIGLFINTIPVRITVEHTMTFSELLLEVQEKAMASERYQYSLLADIQTASPLKQNLFDHIFVFENYPIPENIDGIASTVDQKEGGLKLDILKTETFEQTNYHFNVIIVPLDQLTIKFVFNAHVYDSDFIRRIAGHFNQVLQQILDNEQLETGRITLLTDEERRLLLFQFNDTEVEFPRDKTLHRLFEEQVEETPDKEALFLEDRILTYEELNKRTNQLAILLREKGIVPDAVVGLMTQRSFETVIGIIAILKAGGAYLPIDSHYPAERIAYMMEDSKVKLVLTNYDNEIKSTYSGENVEVLDLGDKRIYCGQGGNPQHINTPTHLVYLIYTSGSTGKPKGVMLEHRNLVNLILYSYDFTNLDFSAVLQFSTISFDASWHEIFSTLLWGGKLFLIAEEIRTDIQGLFNVIEKNKIRTVFLPISLLKVIFSEESYAEIFPGCVTHIQTAGEQVVISDDFRDYLKRNKIYLHNHYGPAETHVVTALTLNPEGEIPTLPPIGKPIANTSIYILDGDMELVPVGVPGELYIGGIQVGRGYLGKRELTAERFMANPFVDANTERGGERLYKTGDLARWMPDGNIEFLGRIDSQVKIRGFRVEPGEVEAHLVRHEKIQKAAVLAKKDPAGEKQLCAYFVCENSGQKTPGIDELNDYLVKKLPAYMIPSCFIQVDHIPLTPNGKVDGRSLPEPGVMGKGEDYVAPRSLKEEKLAGIWSDVLGIEKKAISIDANFFDLGGHSLKATVMVAKIHREFNVKLPLVQMFKIPTIRGLSGAIAGLTEHKYAPVEPGEKREYYALSSAQKRLFFFQQMDLSSVVYNIPQVFVLEGELPPGKLLKVFKKLILRHEALRTSFEIAGSEPIQRVDHKVDFKIQQPDAGFSKAPKKDEMIRNFIKPFDLSRAPLLRVGLIKIGEEKYLLILDMHHIVSDGISHQVLTKDFIRLYAGEKLPPLKLQYHDYSQWHNKEMASGAVKQQEDYWLKVFQGNIPVLKGITDNPAPPGLNFEGDTVFFEIREELSIKMKQLAAKSRTSLYILLLAIFNIMLFKYTGQEDIVIGTSVAGRTHADLQRVIGLFVNMLPIRNRPLEKKTFTDFLKEVKKNALDAFANQDYPFDELVAKLGIERNIGRNPLFDIQFTFENIEDSYDGGGGTTLPGLTVKPYDLEWKFAPFDLSFVGVETPNNTIAISLQYLSALFNRSTVEGMKNHCLEILEQTLENVNIKLADIAISHQLLTVKPDMNQADFIDF